MCMNSLNKLSSAEICHFWGNEIEMKDGTVWTGTRPVPAIMMKWNGVYKRNPHPTPINHLSKISVDTGFVPDFGMTF